MLAGANMVMPGLHLQPAAIIDMLQRERVTVANGVPTIWLGVYEAMKKNPPAEKLPLRKYMVGGSALPASLMEAFDRDFGLEGLHAWGMTETSPLGTVARLQPVHDALSPAEKLRVRATQGVEMPGVEVRVVTEDGTVAPRDGKTVGEIQVRGAWVIGGYYKSDNREAFTDDGWFRTGDVGTLDPLGYMHITDRTKDLIKSGGEWISSVALESALMAHPKVKEATVIAIPHEKWMERPLACVVFTEGASVPDDELRGFLSPHFAVHQLPDAFVPVTEIPKTSVGKFDKKAVRSLYAAGKLGN
jgi:fatty-acyl-CoA synthase